MITKKTRAMMIPMTTLPFIAFIASSIDCGCFYFFANDIVRKTIAFMFPAESYMSPVTSTRCTFPSGAEN